MFGLGMGEILLIAVVALLAVGPDRLPQAARSIGRGIRDLRKQTTDLQQALEQDSQIGDAVRELRSAWYGTTGGLPKNRHELGRALDQMTQVPTVDATSRAELPSPTAAPGASATAPHASGAREPAPAEATPSSAGGIPEIKPPTGTVARGGGDEGDHAPTVSNPGDAPPDDAPPDDAPPDDAPIDTPKPAHG
jgi:sec-independent protein translocase protein TatB